MKFALVALALAVAFAAPFMGHLSDEEFAATYLMEFDDNEATFEKFTNVNEDLPENFSWNE
jgi:hypothetical protein